MEKYPEVELKKINEICGCIKEYTFRIYTDRDIIDRDITTTIIRYIKKCNAHKRLDEEALQKQKEFNIFPTTRSKEIYNILDKLIDELGDCGVDISYFPDNAQKVLKETAIRIDKLK